MNEEVKQFLITYNQSKGYGITDADLIETLQCAKEVSEKESSRHRWWIEVDKVVKIEDKYFEYTDAYTTIDMSARESGWEFDLASVVEVKPKEKVVTIFE